MTHFLSVLFIIFLFMSDGFAQSIGRDQYDLTSREKAGELFLKWSPIVLAGWCAYMTTKIKESNTINPQTILNVHGPLKPLITRIDDLESTVKRLQEELGQRQPHRLVPKRNHPLGGTSDGMVLQPNPVPNNERIPTTTSSYSTLPGAGSPPTAGSAGSVPSTAGQL